MTSVAEGKSVLIIDDEPHALAWLVEYLDSQGHRSKVISDFSPALEAVGNRRLTYDLITIDLMMPIIGGDKALFENERGLYLQFPGLYLARAARNAGYGTSKVMVYSVHDRDEIDAEARRIGVAYAVKGRPRDLKELMNKALAKRSG